MTRRASGLLRACSSCLLGVVLLIVGVDSAEPQTAPDGGTRAETRVSPPQFSPFRSEVPAGLATSVRALIDRIQSESPLDATRASAFQKTFLQLADSDSRGYESRKLRSEVWGDLVRIGRGGIPFLADVLEREQQESRRILAIQVATRLLLPMPPRNVFDFFPWAKECIPLLERTLLDVNAEVRATAAVCVGTMGYAGIEKERIARLLVDMANGEEKNLQLVGAGGLRRMGRKDLVPPALLRELEKRDAGPIFHD